MVLFVYKEIDYECLIINIIKITINNIIRWFNLMYKRNIPNRVL